MGRRRVAGERSRGGEFREEKGRTRYREEELEMEEFMDGEGEGRGSEGRR